MSGEVVVGAAVAGPIGVGVIVGAAAGVACAYVVGKAVNRALDALDEAYVRRQAQEMARQEWNDVVIEVATRNARIESLRANAASRPLSMDIPDPLVLTGQSVEQARAWCGQVDGTLDALASRIAEDARVTLLNSLRIGLTQGRVLTANEVLRTTTSPPAAKLSPATERVLIDLDRVVARLSPEASEEDRRQIASAAARITARSGLKDAQARLQDVRYQVQEANEGVNRRREQAVRAAALMQPLLIAAADPDLLPPSSRGWGQVRAALSDVLAGRRQLEQWMEDAAARCAAEVKAAADHRYIRERVLAGLQELGYTVDEDFETRVPVGGVLSVAHEDWRSHGVRIRLDESSAQLTAMVVRTEADGGWDAAAEDEEREAQWCAHLPELTQVLRRQGIELSLVRATEPGTRVVPMVAASAPASRHRDTHVHGVSDRDNRGRTS